MPMNEKKMLGFRCPHCTQASVIPFDQELLEREGLFSAVSECSHCAILAEKTGSGKIKVTVPCIACPTPHRYTLSPQMLFARDSLVLQCAYSGIDCFFAGDEETVREKMAESDEEIMRVLALEEKINGETVEDSLELSGDGDMVIDSSGGEEVEFFNPEIASDMLFIIKDMAYDEKIRCVCGRTDVDIRVGSEEITFVCPACKRNLVFACRSTSDRARLEDLSEILIK